MVGHTGLRENSTQILERETERDRERDRERQRETERDRERKEFIDYEGFIL